MFCLSVPGAKRPRKIKILGRFAPGTERQNIKCIDYEKKNGKKNIQQNAII